VSGGGKGGEVTIRLLFADMGEFQHEKVRIPAELLERHDRLIDLLVEEPAVLRKVYVDLERLCSAHLVEDQGQGQG
jgi:hypothetical protein